MERHRQVEVQVTDEIAEFIEIICGNFSIFIYERLLWQDLTFYAYYFSSKRPDWNAFPASTLSSVEVVGIASLDSQRDLGLEILQCTGSNHE